MLFIKLASTFAMIMVASLFCENVLPRKTRKLFGSVSIFLFFLTIASLIMGIWF